jgi:predicted nucleic acid-binding protein
MAKRHLLDTNVIIDFSVGRLSPDGAQLVAAILDDQPEISVVTKIELLGFSSVTTQIAEFVRQSHVISLDDDIVEQTILLRKGLKIKLPDAIIASTAISRGLTLVTRNVDDFARVDGLQILNPYTE